MGDIESIQHMDMYSVFLQAAERDPDAQRRLYEMTRGQVYNQAFSYMRSKQDAEDVMQETYIRAFQKLTDFQWTSDAGLRGWLARIGAHCAIDALRKRKRRKTDELVSFSGLVNDPVDPHATPDRIAETTQLMSWVNRTLDQLSPQQRIAFQLRYDRHLEIQDIASILGCKSTSVKKHLERALGRLRNHLESMRRQS